MDKDPDLLNDVSTSQAQAPSKPLTRREIREAERLAALQAQAPAAPLAFASRRERRAAEQANDTAPTVAVPTVARMAPPATRITRPVTAPVAVKPVAAKPADLDATTPIRRPVAPVIARNAAPELPAVVIPAEVEIAPVLAPVAELAIDELAQVDDIELPASFRRNQAALSPIPAARRGSKRAYVRVRRGAAPAASRNSVLRGAAGITALGFAATVAVATTLPAVAQNTTQQESADAIIGQAGGAQTLTVSGSMDIATAASTAGDRAPAYAVATMGTATAYNSTFGIARPDANAYQNDMTAAVQWPFYTGVIISDYYGGRVAPCSGCSSDHKGVDFTPGEGTPIASIAAGRVITVNQVDNGGLGIYVEVEHIINGERVVSVYGHMLAGSIPVKVGDVVNVGDEVGKVGNTGSSTGAHLHLEIHIGGVKVDPFAYLKANNNPAVVVDRPGQPVQA